MKLRQKNDRRWPTEVINPGTWKGLCFPSPRLFWFASGEPPELDSAVFLSGNVISQAELSATVPELLRKRSAICSVGGALKPPRRSSAIAGRRIIYVPATRHFLAPKRIQKPIIETNAGHVLASRRAETLAPPPATRFGPSDHRLLRILSRP